MQLGEDIRHRNLFGAISQYLAIPDSVKHHLEIELLNPATSNASHHGLLLLRRAATALQPLHEH